MFQVLFFDPSLPAQAVDWEVMMTIGKFPVVGQCAEEFELSDSTATPRRLSSFVSRGPVVLIFYRGSW